MKEHIDLKYKEFSAKLIPTLDKDRILGIRMPILRKLAKETDLTYLDSLPHAYHEENILHVLLINQMKDYDECLMRTREFIPYLDNWAVVDAFYPKVLLKDKDRTLSLIEECLVSEHEYSVRFGLNHLRIYYLDEGLELVTTIKHEGYYVRMMQAWLMCDGFIKEYDKAVKILHEQSLDPWVHNKSIQKAVESFRVSDETKEVLKGLKI